MHTGTARKFFVTVVDYVSCNHSLQNLFPIQSSSSHKKAATLSVYGACEQERKLTALHGVGNRSCRLCLILVELAFGNDAAAVAGAEIPKAAAEMPEAAVRLKVALLLDVHAIKCTEQVNKHCEFGHGRLMHHVQD